MYGGNICVVEIVSINSESTRVLSMYGTLETSRTQSRFHLDITQKEDLLMMQSMKGRRVEKESVHVHHHLLKACQLRVKAYRLRVTEGMLVEVSVES